MATGNGRDRGGAWLMPWRHRLFLARRAVQAAPSAGRVPIAPIEEVFPGIGDIELSFRHREERRGLPVGEACRLAMITAWLQPRRIFEIGTGTGEATVLMAAQAPEASIDTLDLGSDEASLGAQRGDLPLEASPVGRAHRGSPYADRVRQHLGDSARFDFAPFRSRIDLVFVDGAHTREYVLSDSRAALEMAGEQGVVLWDDCHLYHPGVSRALARLIRQGEPVVRLAGSRLAVLLRGDPEQLRGLGRRTPAEDAVDAL